MTNHHNLRINYAVYKIASRRDVLSATSENVVIFTFSTHIHYKYNLRALMETCKLTQAPTR